MYELRNKQVLVVGLGERGRAACRLLRASGANVTAIDEADTQELRAEAPKLKALGIESQVGAKHAPERKFDLVVVSPAVPNTSKILHDLRERGIPMVGEFELGYQQSQCLNIAVTGTNGKGTTGELILELLKHNQRKATLCGHGAWPICAAVMEAKDDDYLISQINCFQLERITFFRPAVAVLLNLTPDHLDRYETTADYIRATARIFENQQPFDWAIIQSEALAELRALNLSIPSKVITFSANNRDADIFLERGLLISRVPDWSWPLLDMAQCQLQGSHNAENLMAALAVGHVLRMPLDTMVEVLKNQPAGDHRFKQIAEINGVKYIDDSKATNVDAMHKALLSIPPAPAGVPNTWLIAGGEDRGLEYHYAGPMLSQRVKGVFVIGEAREKLRAAWGLFTPCTVAESLLEAVTMAAENALPGDVVLLSPACSSFDQFRNYQHRGEVFREAVVKLAAAVPEPKPVLVTE